MEQHVTGQRERTRATRLGVASVAVLAVLTAYGVLVADLWKVTGIGWVAFLAMLGFGVVGMRTRSQHPHGLVWGYGLASGAMLTSAAVFLVPGAIGHDPTLGGFGIVYAAMPSLGPLLGLAIVSHKGPAGYAAARRLARTDRPLSMLLLPAAGVGIAALAVGIVGFDAGPALRALVFGFASGIFLHLALDFLPSCETGSEVHEVAQRSGHDHDVLDSLRTQAVLSVTAGGLAVFAAWALL